MTFRSLAALLTVTSLAACESPDQAGQDVGHSLYKASVSTGHAVAVVGDRTGSVLQSAGQNLRGAVSPPPPALPPALPAPYSPPDPSGPAMLRQTPANPALGY